MNAASKPLLLLGLCLLLLGHSNATMFKVRKILQAPSAPGKIIGYVVCDACLEKNFTTNNVLLPGVSVGVMCTDAVSQRAEYTAVGETNKQGIFVIELPSRISEPNFCQAKVLKGTPAACNILSTKTLPLIPQQQQEHQRIFTAGPFVYSPSEALPSCPRKFNNMDTYKGFQGASFPTFPGFPFAGTPQFFPPMATNPPLFPGFPQFPFFSFPFFGQPSSP